ncbi:DUF4845 domain-containing protein [Legionella oakridgensis]|nr:DUF4845 domain-containing protein [Legionella oakridgensis]ETO93767.1 hypothetical protein LOR_73c21130 [Legionella oakridgensis RV-2-2007]KTD43932.1 transmembrane protein [Legionella oakridgensis]STY19663.1 transmembrane protein [Legionella longbeachae]
MHRQQGMTLIGMVLTMAIVIIVGVVLMRVVSVYIQHYSVTNSISALNRIPRSELSVDPSTTAQILKDRLLNQLYVNGIDIPQEKIKITMDKPGTFHITIAYQVTKPLVSNISLLFDFNVSEEVNPGGE